MVALLVFMLATLEKKKMLDTKGPFSGNIFKNPTRLESSSLFLFLLSFSFVSGDFRAYQAQKNLPFDAILLQ